jgi:hypothetical protein
MKQTIWLTFDLGIRGDYESMYRFLDTHNAKECGDRVAVFSYEFEGDLIAKLTEDLRSKVEFNSRSRIYVIYRREDGKPRGRFVVGKRKSPIWTGFGTNVFEEEDVGE